MKGSLRQRSTGSWERTVDLGRDPLGGRWRKLRELLSTLDRGMGLPTKQNKGVAIVLGSTSVIHRPETGTNHGETAMKSDDLELFPNFDMVRGAGYEPYPSCFRGQSS